MRGLLFSPLGFLIGLSLGALGGGGSILAVPALVYGAGQTPQEATTTSLILVGIASLVGMTSHWRAGRVRVRTGILFGLAGIGGSLAGSSLNRQLDPDVLLLGFAGLICVAAWRMVTGCPTCTKVGETTVIAEVTSPAAGSAPSSVMLNSLDLQTLILVLGAGTAVGFLTGLFGVGGGFIIVPALTLALKLPMPEAIGTSLLVIVINSTTALSARDRDCVDRLGGHPSLPRHCDRRRPRGHTNRRPSRPQTKPPLVRRPPGRRSHVHRAGSNHRPRLAVTRRLTRPTQLA